MLDDLAWRLDHAPAREQLFARRVIAVAVATLMVASLWGLSATIFGGRRQLVSCAESAPAPTSRAAFRHDVIRCAGAFFNAAR